ncbi:MAG: SusE domain-containing protein [Bacteroidetes bacterium]|nr:SusE domain-containing protein [Bacteroidota bacterium]MBS1929562.1 SusE domain-containing protein [Bacteroidota bacterium]
MKKIFHLLLSFILLLGIFSCKKEEDKDYYVSSKAPVLTSTVTGTIPLSFANGSQVATMLTWTNPDYMFTTGVSSQNVNYNLEIDTTGANFTNPARIIISLSGDLSFVISQSQLSSYLSNQMGLSVGNPHNIEMRVTASIGGAIPVVSNVLKFTGVIPFAPPPKITPPASGNLFIVGDATPGGWNNPVPVPSQQFTKLSTTMFQITIPITGDKEYKLLSVNGSWDADKQWSIATEQPSGDPSTLNYDLFPNGGNVRAPLASGTYLIVVDFQKGKVTLTKQ